MKTSEATTIPRSRRVRFSVLLGAITVVVGIGIGCPVHAQTGTLLAGPFAPIGGDGNGRGMAFDGVNLYITQVDDSNVYKITPPLPTGPVVTISVPAGDSRVSLGGPLTWDGSALWTVDYSTTLTLYRVNAATGATLFSCSIPSANPGSPALPGLTLPDGLHWTGIAGSELVLSGEIAQEGRPTAVAFIKAADCTITSFFVFPSSPAECCSGVAFDGATLWHATDGAATVFQTDLSGVPTGVSFPTSQVLGFEDLEFDSKTFAPKCALWGTTASTPTVAAYEIPCRLVLTVPGPITVNEEMPFMFTVSATSGGGPSPLIFSARNLPAGATFAPQEGGTSAVFNWTPNSAQGGPAAYFVDFTVSDGQFSDTKTVEITVHDTLVDTDGDGVPDSRDNCKFAYNPDQADVCTNSPQTVTAQTSVTPPGSLTGSLNLTMVVRFSGGTSGISVLPPDLFNTICRVIDNATGQELPQAGVPEGPPVDLSVKTLSNPNGSLVFVAANTTQTFSTSFDLRRFYFPNLVEGSFTINCDYVNFAHIPLPEPDDPTIWTGLVSALTQTAFIGKYTFNGFFSPINNQPFNLGRVVPIKFSLKDSHGAFVTTATAKVFVQQLNKQGKPVGSPIPATPSDGTSGNIAHYDFSGQQYVFNLSTKSMAEGNWQIQVRLDDASTKTVNISLTK